MPYISIMNKPFNRKFFIAGEITVLMMLAMVWQGKPLKNIIATKGIIDLEFAHTTARVQEVLQSWQLVWPAPVWNTVLDFAFIAAYTAFFFNAVLFLSSKRSTDEVAIFKPIVLVAFIPGVLDAIENIFMLCWMHAMIPAFSPAMVYWMVWVKFVLAGILLLIAFPAWLINLSRRLKKTNE
jgi:hypothetical protein